MARLTTAQRKAAPKGVPGKGSKSGSFPIPDKAHARAALREIKFAPPSDRARIRRMAAAKGVGTKSKGK